MTFSMTVKLVSGGEKLSLDLTAEFSYDATQYGNGYYLLIKGSDGFRQYYDIRYDRDFHRDQQELYLLAWAKQYWNGEDGAYRLVGFSIEEEDEG